MNINDPGPHHGPGCFCVLCSRADALQAPLADHGISPAQLREKVEAHSDRLNMLRDTVEALEETSQRQNNEIAQAFADLIDFRDRLYEHLDAALKRIEQLERVIGMSARENQYDISKRPIAPIDQEDV